MSYIAKIESNQDVKLYTSDFLVKYSELVGSWVTVEITEEQYNLISTYILPKYVDDVFFDSYVEVAEVPKELSRMKFKMQVRRSTIYSYEIILAYIQNITVTETFTEDNKQDLIDRLEDCTHFERYDPDFIMIANSMNVSDEIRDEIFIEGNKIV